MKTRPKPPNPLKPDTFLQWHVYQLVDLPEQIVTETTNGVRHKRTGYEQHGPHHGLVVSYNDWNQGQTRGLIVIPMTSAQDEFGREKFSTPQPTWVRVIHDNHPGYVLCEQIRYVDRGRVGRHQGRLGTDENTYDRDQVIAKLKRLFFTL